MTLDEILLKHGAERVSLGSARLSPTWVIKLSQDQERFLTTIALLGAQFVVVPWEDVTVRWPYWETPSGRRVVSYDVTDGPLRFMVYTFGFHELLHGDLISQFANSLD